MAGPYLGDAILPDLSLLAANHRHHSHEADWFKAFSARHSKSKAAIRHRLMEDHNLTLSPLGEVNFTLVEMSDSPGGGGISSVDLFGPDEMILFAFYWMNRSRYRTVVDLGANLGLHSVVLAKMGFTVHSFEPDPVHVQHLERHIRANGVEGTVEIHEAAVSTKSGDVEFLRVQGNTTGSHILGTKPNPYGGLDRFTVSGVSIHEAIDAADLVKMDVEGSEAALICELAPSTFATREILCEVGSAASAESIWGHFFGTQVHLFSQKHGWAKARSADDLPAHHSEGSLFVSTREEMPWGKQDSHKRPD